MQKPIALALLLAAGQASAHPGHDHQHWLAEPIHALSALAIVAIVGTVAYVVRKQKAKQKP
ncbi:MAG: hypothetical protein OIF35_09525 [Cellvibrionaceae bacterium]|nr:hypothetical protein [Cellvibrionaceae bacterium]MCV6625343.1 hypothetical protein [Cellvibrionaceae bacterium]